MIFSRTGATRRPGPWMCGLALAGALASAGCESNPLDDGHDGLTAREWALVQDLKPMANAAPSNPSNRWANDLNAARLGQMLFFETGFSGAIKMDGPSGKKGEVGKVGCVSCHDPNRFFIDSRTAEGISHGVALTGRSSPTLVNLGWYDWTTWAGKHDSLSMQGANAPEAPTDVATTRLLFVHVLYAKYRDEYNAIFPTPLDPALDPAAPDAARFPAAGKPKAAPTDPDGDWEKMAAPDRRIVNEIMANVGKAYEAYERQLVSVGSPFELYLAGQTEKLTERAKRGMQLFVGKAACNECHRGDVLSDNLFHNIGVPQAMGANVPLTDTGRFGDVPRVLANPFNSAGEFSDDREAGKAKLAAAVANDPVTMGQFRTPGLLNIAQTGPFFHNGCMKTLNEVVAFYNAGGGPEGSYSGTKDPKMLPLGLTPDEEADLVAFLESLTGAPVPSAWAADTAKR